MLEIGVGLGVPSMHTASTTILKQNAEQSDPDSFLMPHAFVWSFRLGVNASHWVSGFTQTTSSVIRTQGWQRMRAWQVELSLTVWLGLQMFAPVTLTVFVKLKRPMLQSLALVWNVPVNGPAV